MAIRESAGEGTRATAELYVRSLAPRVGRDRLRETVRDLERLERAGTVDAFHVRMIGEAVPPTPDEAVTEYGVFLATRIALFQDWADATGRTLDPGFDRRSADSAYTDREYEAVVPPALALAEFDGGRLEFVSPCRHKGRSITVEDRLRALERSCPTEGGRTDDGQRSIGESRTPPG